MHSPMATMKRFLFRVIARTAIGLYSYLPIFGCLRASVAVLRKGDLILVIDRNDGRGFSFPGGLARRGETAEQTMRREVHEETGLIVGTTNFLFDYRSKADIPCVISVFEAEVSGSLGESWEGSPRWLSAPEIRSRLLPSQLEVINRV
jgi:8-oxo-dGTP diphosphatase